MKKKILFYGNCVLSTLGQWFYEQHSETFEVIDCEECGVHPSHSTKNFAIWMDSTETQKKYYKCVHEKIKQADYFIFQAIEGAAIDELKTDFLVKNIVNGVSVAIPNLRFHAYPICEISFIPFVKYVYNNISKDKQEIINYIITQNDPKFKEIVFTEYEICMSENKRRYDLQTSVCDFKVDMLNFIENNWKNHQLFGTHNHAIGLYWNELIAKLFEILNQPLDFEKITNLLYPNKHAILDIKQFSFFNELFPSFQVPEDVLVKLDVKNLGRHALNGLRIVKDPIEQYLVK